MPHRFDPTRPVYLQIAELLLRRALRGAIAPGERFASIRETSAELGVNPNTAARAYLELERLGLAEARRGEGTFLSQNAEELDRHRLRLAEEALKKLSDEWDALGVPESERRSLLELLEQ